jgi:hypothetical protein
VLWQIATRTAGIPRLIWWNNFERIHLVGENGSPCWTDGHARRLCRYALSDSSHKKALAAHLRRTFHTSSIVPPLPLAFAIGIEDLAPPYPTFANVRKWPAV